MFASGWRPYTLQTINIGESFRFNNLNTRRLRRSEVHHNKLHPCLYINFFCLKFVIELQKGA